jgi:hypothetical protein
MLTSFVLSMALAAPVPAPAPPTASGPAPRMLELKASPDGKVTITAYRTEMVKVQVVQIVAGGGTETVTREVPVTKPTVVGLGEVKELKVNTADGKKVEVADAVAKLKEGGVVVVSADGKPVSPNFLKALKDDVLVLSAPELVAPQPIAPPIGLPAGGGLAPARPIAVPPGGGVQIQVLPAPVAPPVPAAPPAPVAPPAPPKP